MSNVSPAMASASNTNATQSNIEALFDVALDKYKERTGKDLRNHPLADIIDKCDSTAAIVTIFQEQSRAFDEFRKTDLTLINFLEPIVNGLDIISHSAVLSSGASIAFSPAQVIFSGIGVLLSTAKYVRSSYNTLVDVFECIENFTRRLEIYTVKDIERTPAMTDTIIKIMVEMLAVLALATKQINQGRLKTFAKKLLGEQDIESILARLDRLTLEESKIAVAQTLDVVHGLVNNMEVVMEDGKASTNDTRQTLVLMQELVMEVNKMKRDQLQEKVRRWLSVPDPSTNHNIARKAQHRGTATWFIQGDIFRNWKATGGLLWIQGLPGSGKTVLSSSIIEEVHDMRQMGLALISFFYFDFRDGRKQEVRHLLSSALIQLCDQSDNFSEILSTLFKNHGDGSRQPDENVLMQCLRSMLKLQGRGALYLIVDALDESPNSSGYPTQREQVLAVMRELISLQLPNLHLCITSRPEIDIRNVLEPLADHNVLLHEQAGQNQDIIDYIDCFVQSDPTVRRWREGDKQLVVETLTKKARGMFRWVHCQLETLRRCFPSSIRSILGKLPKTLDQTYERILLEIDEEKRPFAHRLLQCLVISIRPLLVEELAELFVIFPNADSTPNFDIGWRPEDPEAFVLSACSTLVVIVNVNNKRVVQFSHFSVREYLTSARIANSAHVSYFQVLPKPAHALLARTCLSVLLQLDRTIDKTKIRNFPLARYAAMCWVDHARFEDVLPDIEDELDTLFDKNKPHFAAWVWLYNMDDLDVDTPAFPEVPDAVPLYYAALYGFRELSERLLDAHPLDVNAQGGLHNTPLHAALEKRHPDTALLLLERGADVKTRGKLEDRTALYVASAWGYTEVVRSLTDRGADANAECNGFDYNCDSDDEEEVLWTPLMVASNYGTQEIAKILLDHGEDVDYVDNNYSSPLGLAMRLVSQDLARLLLDHGADPNGRGNSGSGMLHDASSKGEIADIKLLLEYDADVDDRDSFKRTPLHRAAIEGQLEAVKLLIDNGADLNAQNKYSWSALHMATLEGHLQVVEVLLQHGADLQARTKKGNTAFDLASKQNHTQITQLLLRRIRERINDTEMRELSLQDEDSGSECEYEAIYW